jgi:hypothetical protein
MRLSTPSPPLVTLVGITLSEAVADSLEAQLQPVNGPSDPAVIETVDEALRAYYFTTASEPKLSNPVQLQDVIRGLKVDRAPGPNGIPIRALMHPTQRARILSEVSGRELLLDETFGFRPTHSMSLQLAHLVERVTGKCGEMRLTGAIFLDVAKAFDTVWFDCLLHMLMVLNFSSDLVKTTSSFLHDRASFQTASYTSRCIRTGVP